VSDCYCDYDMPSMHIEAWHKARKQHTCCECGQAVIIGQQYQRVALVFEGQFSTYKTCERCADLRDALAAVSCPSYRGLREEYWNYLEQWLGSERCAETYRRVFPVVSNV